MNEAIYPYRKSLDILSFEFESDGPNGLSKKKVVYSQLEGVLNMYNLSLFEVMPDGSLDIYAESKNQDLPRIMATMIGTIFEFFKQYPKSKIVFTGSTISRTRLYRIVISKLFEQNKDKFEIEGITETSNLEPFRLNQTYIAYVISQKSIIFMPISQPKQKKGRFKSLEEAVAFKNNHLMKILKGVDLQQLNKSTNINA